jgi:hypothetical protein
MRTRLAAAVLFSAAALTLAACGSGGGTTIAKSEFLRSANQICAGANADIGKLKSPSVDPAANLTTAQLKEVGDYLDQALKIQNALIRKLRDLGTPKGDDKKLTKLYDGSDSGSSELQLAAKAAHDGNLASFRDHLKKGGAQLDASQRGVTDYGLDKCGQT